LAVLVTLLATRRSTWRDVPERVFNEVHDMRRSPTLLEAVLEHLQIQLSAIARGSQVVAHAALATIAAHKPH
jgi:hypothetical protein